MGVLTAAIARKTAVNRCRAVMSLAGMDTTNVDTFNDDLNDPLATALEELGLAAADRSNVVDDDLGQLSQTLQPRFLDLLEIRVLESCLNGLLAGPNSQEWEDYKEDRKTASKDTQALIAFKRQQYLAKWAGDTGPAVGRMERATRHNLRTDGYWYRGFP